MFESFKWVIKMSLPYTCFFFFRQLTAMSVTCISAVHFLDFHTFLLKTVFFARKLRFGFLESSNTQSNTQSSNTQSSSNINDCIAEVENSFSGIKCGDFYLEFIDPNFEKSGSITLSVVFYTDHFL